MPGDILGLSQLKGLGDAAGILWVESSCSGQCTGEPPSPQTPSQRMIWPQKSAPRLRKIRDSDFTRFPSNALYLFQDLFWDPTLCFVILSLIQSRALLTAG